MSLGRHVVDSLTPVRGVAAFMERNGAPVVVLLDQDDRLQGLVTGGDILRALLQDFDWSRPIADLVAERSRAGAPEPMVARHGMPRAELVELMSARSIRSLPLLDQSDRVVDVAMLDDLASPSREFAPRRDVVARPRQAVLASWSDEA